MAETVVDCGRTHTERLVMTVDWILSQASLRLQDIDALAITIGPGSFTGLRVGVAAFKGLALGQGLHLVPVPTLDAMARLVGIHQGCVCPLLDAKMGEVFGAAYRFEGGVREKLTDDLVAPVERVLEHIQGPAIFLGDGASLYHDRIRAICAEAVFAPPLCSVPRASAVAAEAAELVKRGVRTDAASVAPVYLRESQPEERQSRVAKA